MTDSTFFFYFPSAQSYGTWRWRKMVWRSNIPCNWFYSKNPSGSRSVEGTLKGWDPPGKLNQLKGGFHSSFHPHLDISLFMTLKILLNDTLTQAERWS